LTHLQLLLAFLKLQEIDQGSQKHDDTSLAEILPLAVVLNGSPQEEGFPQEMEVL
jgi:hypothetical protein